MHRAARHLPGRRPRSLPRRAWLFGLWPGALDNVLDDYADTVPGGMDYDLALWHGLNLPLLLSVLVLATGTAAFFGRQRLQRLRTVREALGQRRPSSTTP